MHTNFLLVLTLLALVGVSIWFGFDHSILIKKIDGLQVQTVSKSDNVTRLFTCLTQAKDNYDMSPHPNATAYQVEKDDCFNKYSQ